MPLIDESGGNNGSVTADRKAKTAATLGTRKDPYTAVNVMNIMLSARLNGYRGLIAVLCGAKSTFKELCDASTLDN